MESLLLGIMIVNLLTVFAIDTSRKRHNDNLNGK